ncbi:MAG: alpha/beta fold hydrolase [Acidimicrobiales bacterium]
MPTYTHDGLELHYDTFGLGPAVLCIHGATGTGIYEWGELSAALSDRYECVVPDLRGHGRSGHRAGDLGIEQVNGDLLALIEHERLGRPHVMAFSFGAEAALDLELLHPGTCRSLVLISPGLGDPKSSVPSQAQLEAGWPRALRQLHADHHGERHWLDVMLELCDRAARRPKAELEALASIACPILLIVGTGDDPRRIRQAEVLEGAHPRCWLVVVEGARHAVHKDRPAEVAAAAGSFLAGVP